MLGVSFAHKVGCKPLNCLPASSSAGEASFTLNGVHKYSRRPSLQLVLVYIHHDILYNLDRMLCQVSTMMVSTGKRQFNIKTFAKAKNKLEV